MVVPADAEWKRRLQRQREDEGVEVPGVSLLKSKGQPQQCHSLQCHVIPYQGPFENSAVVNSTRLPETLTCRTEADFEICGV